MTHEEINALKAEIFAEADNKYVAINVCNDNQEKINNSFANDDKRIDLIAHDFGVIKKLMWAMATTSIGLLITALFELIKG